MSHRAAVLVLVLMCSALTTAVADAHPAAGTRPRVLRVAH